MTRYKKPKRRPKPVIEAPPPLRLPSRRVIAAIVGTLVIAAAAGVYVTWPKGPRRAAPVTRAPTRSATFVGRAACARCHEREDSLWRGSHHDLAMQPATSATVLGDFHDTRFTHFGVTTTFSAHDGKFFARTDGPDGALHDYEIAYTFGVYPLQQYLVAFPGGRYQALNVVWDARPRAVGGQHWFHLYPAEAVAHDDILHWTGPYQNWNFMCAECHSTNVVKGYDAATGSYRTTYSEVNVSCEACHGPGSNHVAWGEAVAGDETKRADPEDGLVVDLRDSVASVWIVDSATGLPHREAPRSSHAEVEMCARCHARRSVLTAQYVPGRPLTETHRPSTLQDPLYFADGQIHDEVYEYGSFRQSRMYHRGVTCTDCHDPHRGAIAAPVDAVCGRCHPPARFAVAAHTHHKAGSAGSSCVNCHMPTRDYMVVHARHDHSLRIPRPDLSVALGTPNACTSCHQGKPATWAAAAAAKWWTTRAGEAQFGQALDLGRRAARGAGTALTALASDTAAPAVARASAIELLGRSLPRGAVETLQRALWDPDPLVRDAGIEAASALAPAERVTLIAPLLSDPVRLVRVDAARALAPAPSTALSDEQRAAFTAAIAEYREEQRVNGDRAEARLNLGAYFAETGHADSAATEYSAALRMNPSLLAAYVNLADLYRLEGKEPEAERVLRAGLAHAPRGAGAELQYALGLTYVRQHRLKEALAPLQTAAALAPEVARYALVYALALQQLGKVAEARGVLEQALARHPEDRELIDAYVSIVRPRSGP